MIILEIIAAIILSYILIGLILFLVCYKVGKVDFNLFGLFYFSFVWPFVVFVLWTLNRLEKN